MRAMAEVKRTATLAFMPVNCQALRKVGQTVSLPTLHQSTACEVMGKLITLPEFRQTAFCEVMGKLTVCPTFSERLTVRGAETLAFNFQRQRLELRSSLRITTVRI